MALDNSINLDLKCEQYHISRSETIIDVLLTVVMFNFNS